MVVEPPTLIAGAAPSAPRVTVGIPLHRSRPFVDVVSANIEALPGADVEILLSDRTGLDDALDVLAARHGADRRVATLRAHDRAGWVQHCNALLRRARGRYFCWMPHDDSFPAEWVPTLVRHLEAEPDLLMAFGRVEPLEIDGTPDNLEDYRHPAPGTGAGTWTVGDAVTALRRWRGGYAFRGLFRREPVVARGLFLPATRDGIDADVAWVFGMALLGRLRYVPEVACLKRYHAASAHRTWRRRVRHDLSLGWTLGCYAARYGGSPGATAVALAAAAQVTAKRLALNRLPDDLRRAGRRALRGAPRSAGRHAAGPS